MVGVGVAGVTVAEASSCPPAPDKNILAVSGWDVLTVDFLGALTSHTILIVTANTMVAMMRRILSFVNFYVVWVSL